MERYTHYQRTDTSPIVPIPSMSAISLRRFVATGVYAVLHCFAVPAPAPKAKQFHIFNPQKAGRPQ